MQNQSQWSKICTSNFHRHARQLNGLMILQAEDARYLGLHLDCRLNCRKHIFTKRKQLGTQLRKMYWILDNKSQLSIEKLLLYRAILKLIWTYGMQLWGNSIIEIIQRFQTKYLRIIVVNAAWYVTSDTLHHDLNIPYVRNEIKNLSQRYADRLVEHPNILEIDLMSEAETSRRLKRKQPQDLYIYSNINYNLYIYMPLGIYSSRHLHIVKCITECYA